MRRIERGPVRGGARASRRSPRAARASRSSWDNSRALAAPPRARRASAAASGACGSPIDRLIGASAGFGVDAGEPAAAVARTDRAAAARGGDSRGGKSGANGARWRRRLYGSAARTAAADAPRRRSGSSAPARGWRRSPRDAARVRHRALGLARRRPRRRWRPRRRALRRRAAPPCSPRRRCSAVPRPSRRPIAAHRSAQRAPPGDLKLLGVFAGARRRAATRCSASPTAGRCSSRRAGREPGRAPRCGVRRPACASRGRRRDARDRCCAIRCRWRRRRPPRPCRRRASTRGALRAARGIQGPGLPAQRRTADRHGRAAGELEARCSAESPGGLVVRDDSGFAAMLGLKPGDRMREANGIALAADDDVLVAVVKPLHGEPAGARARRARRRRAELAAASTPAPARRASRRRVRVSAPAAASRAAPPGRSMHARRRATSSGASCGSM